MALQLRGQKCSSALMFSLSFPFLSFPFRLTDDSNSDLQADVLGRALQSLRSIGARYLY